MLIGKVASNEASHDTKLNGSVGAQCISTKNVDRFFEDLIIGQLCLEETIAKIYMAERGFRERL